MGKNGPTGKFFWDTLAAFMVPSDIRHLNVSGTNEKSPSYQGWDENQGEFKLPTIVNPG